MAVLLSFLLLVAIACTVALTDWRRAWLLAILVGVLQDPARKLTPGMPVYLTFSIIGIYAAILIGAREQLAAGMRDFTRRFNQLWAAFGILFLCLALATLNGIATFGIALWKAPLVSLFTYLAPLPAVLFGYVYLDREERLFVFFRAYSLITSVALIGAPAEYLRLDWPALGMVQQVGDYIRHLPGIQIRMISGFYRAPDIMGWHAATLTCIGIGMMVRAGIRRSSWPWMVASGWGFLNCMISGRRKAVYFVAVFAVIFVWRYIRSLTTRQLVALVSSGLVLALVIHRISSDEDSKNYARGAVASQQDFQERLEGGVFETIQQFGFMGAGLGTATQGVQHLLGDRERPGWQEGGLGKLAIELGVPGLLAALLVALAGARVLYAISGVPDLPETGKIGRVMLFALVVANITNFMASAQAYSDPVLALITCFFVGSLFATAALDERVAAAKEASAEKRPLVYAPQA
jgi:hypothetical protein